MSWQSFDRTVKADPAFADAAERVVSAMRALPTGPGIDPIVLEHHAHVGRLAVFATLGALITSQLGRFAVQVLDDRGMPVREFASMDDTPGVVTDDYGEEIEVEPANTRIVFRPSWK